MNAEKAQAVETPDSAASALSAGLERTAFDAWWNTIVDLRNEQSSNSVGGFINVRMAFEAGAKAEREACALLCCSTLNQEYVDFGESCANAIRGRSNVS